MMDWQPGALVELTTERFIIRSMLREDVTEAFLSWMRDPEVMVGLNMPKRKLSRAQAVRYVLSNDNQNRFLLGIHSKSSETQIGFSE